MGNEFSGKIEQRRGVVVFLLSNVGSKSEGVLPYLYLNKDDRIALFLKGDNPFENEGLLPYDGKSVSVKGTVSRYGKFLVEEISLSKAEEASTEEVVPPAEVTTNFEEKDNFTEEIK